MLDDRENYVILNNLVYFVKKKRVYKMYYWYSYFRYCQDHHFKVASSEKRK